MTTGYMIAIGIGLFSFVMIVLLGVIGTFEAIERKNNQARWKQWEEWSKKKQKNSQPKVRPRKKQGHWHTTTASAHNFVEVVVIL